LAEGLQGFFSQHADFARIFTAVIRWVFPLLAVGILWIPIRSLLRVRQPKEVWAHLELPGETVALTHWENIVGRARSSDVLLRIGTVSRIHAALIRDREGGWTLHDLGSKSGTSLNGRPFETGAVVTEEDVLSFGGVEAKLRPVGERDLRHMADERYQYAERPEPPWGPVLLTAFFNLFAVLQLTVAAGGEVDWQLLLIFPLLPALELAYCLALRAFRRVGFEMEVIAFFLSGLSLAVTASSAPDSVAKQFAAIVIGLFFFLALGFCLRDLGLAVKLRPLMGIGALGLLGVNLLFGRVVVGARNWLAVGGFSFQPSELVKVAFIFAGAATLERLFAKRNLTLFLLLSAGVIGALALMNDFGTAAIFFVTFLVIAFLRSGDFATLALIVVGAGLGGLLLLRFKPHIAARFSAWGRVWEQASGAGYQQTRAMSAAASGGLVGVGAGEGWLKRVAAADTDLVFGFLCEEWGLIIALLAAFALITLAVFAVRAAAYGRSSYYTIAACAASSLLLFQAILNVFGAVDLLPLTGVTFPFVSNGGSSMVAAWGLLAFLKAADTRQNASFAIRLPRRVRGGEAEDEMLPLPLENESSG